ncbi:HNH endonuclease signature motif containing protein [Mycobacterium basiliense]|nr:HNH endonuclease signature motif containing protein [Mycobacterium basiliense]
MFGTRDVESWDALAPDQLVTAIDGIYRLESALTGRRLAAVAALLRRRSRAELSDPDLAYATIDGVEQVGAEVSAALNLSPAAASYQVHYAEVLDTRLRRIGALLCEGHIDWRTAQLIISRTDLVDDDKLVAQLDESLAGRICDWRGWSRQRIVNAIDRQVLAIDPDAARERRRRADNEREIGITPQLNGMAELWGTVTGADATAFDRKLSQLATTVCRNDPRTMQQRRADALGALVTSSALSCRCGAGDCPARTSGAAEAARTQVLVNVVATADTLSGQSQQPGYVEGYGVIDADQVRELAARAQHLSADPATATAALKYHPSAALDRAVRCRDLTCRFPGCSRPASVCDIDHTIPFDHTDPGAGGLTVLGNLKCLCRQHHRLKTFHRGATGWHDRQLPDGTVTWTSPTGKTYRTVPAGAELFSEPAPCRSRTRARERAARVTRARTRNHIRRMANVAEDRLRQAREQELESRKFRNHMRDMLFLFKGNPSTSPFCQWVNEPREVEELPADWQPPPVPTLPDDPPF